jgi:glycosyltransferase involved in cell wall biosynthesis/SAM-dependent methyltransferase
MSDLSFTGERMVPGKVDPHLEFEHVSRYRFAASWARDRRVVDLGTGAGYGAAMLGVAGARSVLGLDIAVDAVRHALQRYGREGLRFAVADCTQRCVAAGAAELITAFEVVEHLHDYRGLLAGAREMLTAGGLFMVSTPNRSTYAEARQGTPNPYHVIEFEAGEFEALLREYFPCVALLGQSTTEGMIFRPFAALTGREAAVSQELDDPEAPDPPDYLVAVCGSDSEAVRRAARSGFIPSRGNLLRRRDRRIGELQSELEDRTRWATSLSSESEERGRKVLELQTELEQRTRWARQLEADLEGRGERERHLAKELEEERRRIAESEAEIERQRRETKELKRELEERIAIARKLRREGAERDRQFLLRLRELESLEARVGRLEGDVQRVADLEEGIEDLAGRWREAEDRSRNNSALLRWQGDSAVDHAARIRVLESASVEVDDQVRHLEAASYQHQIGLDYHSDRIAGLGDELAKLEDRAQGQGAAMRRADEAAGRVAATVDGLLSSGLWRGYSRLATGARSLLGRSQPGQAVVAEHLARATDGMVPARRPRVSLLLLLGPELEPALRTLRSFARQTDCACEAVVTALRPSAALKAALAASPRLRYVGSAGTSADAVRRGLRAARAERVLVAQAGVELGEHAVRILADSLDTLLECRLVMPRLLSSRQELVTFGGAIDDAGRPTLVGAGEDWDGLEYSFAQPTGFAPGPCLMADRELLLKGAAAGGLEPGLAGAARLAGVARRLGASIYVQPAASAVCGEAQAAELEAGSSRAAFPAADALSHAVPARPRILVVDHRLPTPDQDAGSVRMRALLKILHEFGFAVTFLPENLQATSPYCEDLQRSGIEVVALPWAPSAYDYIAQHGGSFDCAIVSRCHIADDFMAPLRSALGSKPIVFDTVDLQFLREGRRVQLEGGAGTQEVERLKVREFELSRLADAVLVVSPFEQRMLQREVPGIDVRLVSTIHDAVGRGRGFFGRRGVFFLGGFEHPPNRDAVEWLVEEIAPRLRREIPELPVHVVGSNASTEVKALASDSVTIAGWVKDLTPYLDGCRLSVAPLRYGAGVKGKINLSLAHGVPCVATSVAAEGMGLVHGRDVIIADTAAEFAAAVVRVHGDPWLWRRLSRNGLRNTRERFSTEVARQALHRLFTDLGIETRDSSTRRRFGR